MERQRLILIQLRIYFQRLYKPGYLWQEYYLEMEVIHGKSTKFVWTTLYNVGEV
jgi:hypothetical protein